MRLILLRHGNTFGPEDKIVMAGLKNDLPLVAKGFVQATDMASALRGNSSDISAVYAAELRRTREMAETICEANGYGAYSVDERLNELDYGDWTGKTDLEIDAQFGAEIRARWQKESVWPEGANWGADPVEVQGETHNFAEGLLNKHSSNETVLAVSSNGRLRYFLTLVPGAWAEHHAAGTVKVKTGYGCVMLHDGTEWHVLGWNLSPDEMKEML